MKNALNNAGSHYGFLVVFEILFHHLKYGLFNVMSM